MCVSTFSMHSMEAGRDFPRVANKSSVSALESLLHLYPPEFSQWQMHLASTEIPRLSHHLHGIHWPKEKPNSFVY